MKSQKSFEITKDINPVVPLEKVQDLPQYQRIAVEVKVMHADVPFELCSGEKVQEVIIADASGHAKLNILGGTFRKNQRRMLL